MYIFLRVLNESFLQAIGQLTSNKLRSFLSLLGITIGIFCIISVKSAVDSLEENVRGSFEKLGEDVIYISKLPWNEDPGENYWKYGRRPVPNYNDFVNLKQHLKTAKFVSYSLFIGSKVIKYQSNSVDNVFELAVTHEYGVQFKLEFEAGRWFNNIESEQGLPKVVIGHNVSLELFGSLDPIGKKVKVFGKDMEVVGVIKKSGKDLVSVVEFDNATFLPFELARSIVNVKPNFPWAGSLQVKAADGVSLDKLKDDVTMTLRSSRKLKPAESTNFALNNLSMIAAFLDSFFAVLNIAGFMIGIFALLVGIFSVANIMFVSVKERTNIIGIKKAIGAKKNVILIEFLIESVILCIVGGLFGLILVFIVLKGISAATDFEIYISAKNVLIAVITSIIVGIFAGMIPAIQASNMDPVEAIRS
jgi:putative ABC transport system permease protein